MRRRAQAGRLYDFLGRCLRPGPRLPLLWTELGARWSLQGIIAALSSKQAKQVGLEARKGELVVGADADFVVFDPQAEFQVTLVSLPWLERS